MSWTHEQLTTRLKENPHLRCEAAVAVVECRDENAPLPAHDRKTPDHDRVRIVITCRRARTLDPDNVCEKFLIDCIRRAGLIREDTNEEISIEIRQEKVRSYKDEETIVTLEYA